MVKKSRHPKSIGTTITRSSLFLRELLSQKAHVSLLNIIMTTLRQFCLDDLLRFNNINLDVLTETYNGRKKKGAVAMILMDPDCLLFQF